MSAGNSHGAEKGVLRATSTRQFGGLSVRESQLATLVGQGVSAHEAALKVGYAPTTALVKSAEIAKRPKVQAAIRRVRAANSLACEVTREWIVATYALIARNEQLSPADRMQALKGIRELLGHDAPPAAANINHRHIFSTMSDADLVAERARLEPHVIDVTPEAGAINGKAKPMAGPPSVREDETPAD